jgi:hypothetical protein
VRRFSKRLVISNVLTVAVVWLAASPAWADGKMFVPRDYKGSVEERSQEAVLIFHGSETPGGAIEDLILKVSVHGEADRFAWVIPFPTEPKAAKEDAKLFAELHAYVEARLAQLHRSYKGSKGTDNTAEARPQDAERPVEVLSRKIVGSYDVAVVRENEEGGLNRWLEEEGYQTLEAGDDVIRFYREKGYAFACVKVSDAKLAGKTPVDLHPLRFSFKTGGRDAMYFPMKMTGLQEDRFDVNLYVFYGAWINDRLNKFGYEHRGFRRKYRDWDTRDCKPNAGKTYSTPGEDVFLKDKAHVIPTVKKLFQKLHPGEKYYLTNIQAFSLDPEEVREWSDDLWLFPYYVDRSFVPHDAQPGGPASGAWPNESAAVEAGGADGSAGALLYPSLGIGAGVVVLAAVAVVGVVCARRTRVNAQRSSGSPA